MEPDSGWPGTRAAGLERLAGFLPRAGREYRAKRNHDHGAGRHTNVSGLSPYLRCRLLAEREVVARVLDHHSRDSVDKFLQEVFWRAYWKGWLEQHPGAWQRYTTDLALEISRLAEDDHRQLCYESAITGQTGIDAFDAWVSELIETGYLHNHARMWFASIWTFTLRLPWVLGADFFLRHLLDGDPASNTLSWRWVAGLHTRGKTYLARPENIERYTGGRFRRLHSLAEDAPALEDETIPREPLSLPADARVGPRVGLLLTDEDLTLPSEDSPVGVKGLVLAQDRSPLPVGRPALRFAHEAVEDAVERAAKAYRLDGADQLPSTDIKDVASWAHDLRLDEVVTNYVPVGPARVSINGLRAKLDALNIGWREVLADYDRLTWPHAGAGFFKLKKQIPALLDELGIAVRDGPRQQPQG